MKFSKLSLRLLGCVLLVLSMFVDEAEGKRKKRRSKKHTSYAQFRTIVGIIMFCLFAPAVGQFVLALYRDPAVPKLIAVTVEAAKRRFFSFLGRSGARSGGGDGDGDGDDDDDRGKRR